MKSRAAVAFAAGQPLQVVEIDVVYYQGGPAPETPTWRDREIEERFNVKIEQAGAAPWTATRRWRAPGPT